MIQPCSFGFNEETAIDNHFQQKAFIQDAQAHALSEFNLFVNTLRNHSIDVLVVEDTPSPRTPDSIFPNNWISSHENGVLVLYPMHAHNRRNERKRTVIDAVKNAVSTREIIDLTHYENAGKILEGTGSMVLDRKNRIAYACISQRTDRELFTTFCRKLEYTPLLFQAADRNGREIYHTNVLMCMADRYVVICLEAIPDQTERNLLTERFMTTGKSIIPITLDQMEHFCGNMLQVENTKGELFIVMSTQAFNHLLPEQRKTLEQFNPIIHSELTTIETLGGGSARCMMAELFE